MNNELNNNVINLHTFNLLSSLLSILNTNDELDTDFVIAKYLLNNLNDLKNISIYKVAEDCFVSRSSVQRFIKNIGYDSYTQLKASLDNVISHESGFIDYTDHAYYSEHLIESINQMSKDICESSAKQGFKKIIDYFMEADNIVLLTAEDSSYPCKIFQQELVSIGKIVRIITNANTNKQILESLNKNDLLLVSSITGNFALAIDSEVQNIKAKKILVTLNRSAIFENSYSYIYYIGNSVKLNSRILVAVRNVYNNYGLSLFLDLVYHECYLRRNKH